MDTLTNNPRLGGVEITDWFDIPRVVDKMGRQRQGIFIFQFKNSEDREKLKRGQIVELTNEDKKMEDRIFFDDYDELSGRYFIVDEDENSIWAYLTLPDNEEVDKDCFLGSRIEILIEDFDDEKYKNERIPPPMIKSYSTKKSYLPNLRGEDISVEWGIDGNVILKINGNEFLFFTDDESKGFCKSIKKTGMYGNEWSEEKFTQKMK